MLPKFFITTTVPTTFTFFRGQLQRLNEEFEVCAISSIKKELENFGHSEGVRTHYIDMSRPISLWRDLKSLFRFISFFLKERPTIVHGNTPKAALLSMVAGWLTRRPVRIYMCHGLRYQGTSGKMRSLLMWMERITCKCATHVVCVSEGVKNTFASDGICKPKKMRVIGYGSAGGIDLKHYDRSQVHEDIRAKLNIPTNGFVFAYVGRVVKDKGINELLHAFDRLAKEYKNCYLIIVGPEEVEQNPISEESRQIMRGNSQVFAVGRQSDVRPFLAAADGFVLPSYREGFGMVLIEAGAMGVPSITTNIIGCNEVIHDSVNGDIVESKDEEALYKQMKQWITHPEMVRQYSLNARKMVENRYEQQTVWQTYRDFYRQVAER
ncbi:MAG: glycosyltransferase family 4 protein [Muribaculaceae bacterium]|nr:glycosyltransferase family 4 protein [Muribaculaceae bacterium]